MSKEHAKSEIVNIWEGVYDRFPPGDAEDVFGGEHWVGALAEQTRQMLDSSEESRTIPAATLVHEYPLAPVAASLMAMRRGKIRILDFGGGMGASFVAVAASCGKPEALEFHIVEGSRVCERGRQLHAGTTNLYFHESLPDVAEAFDLVHAGSSLHYVKDWRGMLRCFTDYSPSMILLAGLPAGDIQTFACYQNYYGRRMPMWFLNVGEVIGALDNLGYCLVYRSLLASRCLGKMQPMPMDNFPPERRIARKCNLLFADPRVRDRDSRHARLAV